MKMATYGMPTYGMPTHANLQRLEQGVELSHVPQATLGLPKPQKLGRHPRKRHAGIHAQAAAVEGSGRDLFLKRAVAKLCAGLNVERSGPMKACGQRGDVCCFSEPRVLIQQGIFFVQQSVAVTLPWLHWRQWLPDCPHPACPHPACPPNTPCKGVDRRQRVGPGQQPQQVGNKKMPRFMQRNPPRIRGAQQPASGVHHQRLKPALGGDLVDGKHEKDKQGGDEGGVEVDGVGEVERGETDDKGCLESGSDAAEGVVTWAEVPGMSS